MIKNLLIIDIKVLTSSERSNIISPIRSNFPVVSRTSFKNWNTMLWGIEIVLHNVFSDVFACEKQAPI